MNTVQPSKNRVFEFAENHPHLLIAVIIILIILLVAMYFGSSKRIQSMIGRIRKKKTKEPFDTEEEMDRLIASIHSKQMKHSGPDTE
jgi:hypothetical protein